MSVAAIATITNPSAALTDFSLIVDLSRMPAAWWTAVDTTDGTRGRVYKGDGTTRLPADWIDFDGTADTGLLRVKWTGTLATTGTQELHIESPDSTVAAVLATDTYGSDNAYDDGWDGYWPLTSDFDDRTSNSNDGTGNGGIVAGSDTGPMGEGATDFVHTSSQQILITGTPVFDAGSIIVWAAPDTTTNNEYLWDSSWSSKASCLHNSQDGYFNFYGGGYPTGTASDSQVADNGAGNWAHLAWTFASATDTLIGYGDGVEEINVTSGSTMQSNSGFRLGSYGNGLSGFFDGSMCHFQFHSIVRSADWISSEYDQTSDQAAFWGTWTVVGGSGSAVPIIMQQMGGR